MKLAILSYEEIVYVEHGEGGISSKPVNVVENVFEFVEFGAIGDNEEYISKILVLALWNKMLLVLVLWSLILCNWFGSLKLLLLLGK